MPVNTLAHHPTLEAEITRLRAENLSLLQQDADTAIALRQVHEENARLRQGLEEVRDLYLKHKELGGHGRANLMLEAALVALASA